MIFQNNGARWFLCTSRLLCFVYQTTAVGWKSFKALSNNIYISGGFVKHTHYLYAFYVDNIDCVIVNAQTFLYAVEYQGRNV